MLCKARHFVPKDDLRTLYFAIFSSHLTYASQIWGQVTNSFNQKIFKLQSRALRIITFADFRADSNPIYRDLNILKLRDQIAIQNCLFVHDSLNNNSPSCFSDYFNLTRQIHPLHTRNASLGCLYPKDSNTTRFGLYSITNKCISIWNALSGVLNTDLATFSRYQLKCRLFHFLKKDY